MPSLIAGYEYDIFVSYRHNDNRSGWVTEFVKNLEAELAATIKEPLSVYFDKDSQDGLLETHSVDQSLDPKLNALILIPIISQTYCDPKSFAWQREFLVFCERAKADRFGSNVKLANGNVSSRILPVRIHNLDPADQSLFEKQTGGGLRCIDFVFMSPGVNRPLRHIEEHSVDNLNKTFYRDQLNKVANAIKDITASLRYSGSVEQAVFLEVVATAEKDEKSIAVLPFVNMSNDPEQEYFSDGVSEEIINTLVQLPGLKVAGRTSAFSFKGKNEDLRLIGEQLGVTKILEGSIRKSGSRIRITAQLVDVTTGFHLWSQKFDRELDDIFAVQDEIAGAIANELEITLGGKMTKAGIRLQTQNVQAYELYLKGRELMYQRGAAIFEGNKCFQAALRLDPDYALALAGLADSYSMMGLYGFLPANESMEKGLPFANRAIELAPDMAEPHAALATIAILFERKYDKAEHEYRRALELNPDYTQARIWFALFYLQLVRVNHHEAIENARLAVGKDPLSAYARAIYGVILCVAGKHSEAIRECEFAVALDPTSYVAHWELANVYHWAGNLERSEEVFLKSLAMSGRHPWSMAGLMVTYCDMGELEKGNDLLEELKAQSKEKYVQPALIALGEAVVGRPEEAIRWASHAVDVSDSFMVVMAMCWPDSVALRKLPDFGMIQAQLGVSDKMS